MKKTYLLIPALLATLLTACGGGGGGGGGSSATGSESATNVIGASTLPAVAASSNTGSVSAPFVRSTTAKYILLAIGSQQFGALNSSTQDAAGVLTNINSTTFNGPSTKDISGDAGFAQGRWVAGTVTNSNGSVVLTGTSNAAYHYLAYNSLAALPTSGSATCDAGTFTAPMYTGGAANFPATGATTGNAAITFGTSGATVSGTLTSTAQASTGSVTLKSTIGSPSSTGNTGAFLANGAGASVALGTDGGTGYVVATGYTVILASGAKYVGVANFHCK